MNCQDEVMWRIRRHEGLVIDWLRESNVDVVVGPNYSGFWNWPVLETLRSNAAAIMFCERALAAGLCVIPNVVLYHGLEWHSAFMADVVGDAPYVELNMNRLGKTRRDWYIRSLERLAGELASGVDVVVNAGNVGLAIAKRIFDGRKVTWLRDGLGNKEFGHG